jgi:dipeptidyl aminopeptidase/acylaminoacyl peptidase
VVRVLLLALASLAVAAPAGAAPYVETKEPARKAIGTVVLVHGGAWAVTGRKWVAELRPTAARFRRAGIRTVNADYRTGTDGLADLERVVDRERRRGPVCVYGESAGGHWALMLAAERPWIRCVLAYAAPTDFAALGDSGGPGLVAYTARALFGAAVDTLTPVLRAGDIHARVFLAAGQDDPQVPPTQAVLMHEALPGSVLKILPPGEREWMHGSADAAAADRLDRRAVRFAAAALRG